MTPATIERVFGRTRLKMVTGRYVEVFREEAAPGEKRRYTKRFLADAGGDFRQWTEREWRLLARLVGHGVKHVPEIVQFDRGSNDKTALVQTYDAGVTIDHWANLLPVQRGGHALRHVFQDCAHWWALAQNFLLALKEIHQLQLVHLDLKADNVCLPLAPTLFNPHAADQLLFPVFEQLALIDFAFSLVTGAPLESPLPIGAQPKFRYQSPRLLEALAAGRRGDVRPTRELDWRCDMFSLAAMLERYLPAPERFQRTGPADGWTDARHVDAKELLREIRDAHDRDVSTRLPHDGLLELTRAALHHRELADSLDRGWTLAAHPNSVRERQPTMPMTPLTLIESPAYPLTVVEDGVVPAAQDGWLRGSGAASATVATLLIAPTTHIEPRAPLAVPLQELAAPPVDAPLPVSASATAATAPVPSTAPVGLLMPDPPIPPEAAMAPPAEPAGPIGDAALPVEPGSRRRGRTLGYAAAIVAAIALLMVIANVARTGRNAARQPIARAGQPASAADGGSASSPQPEKSAAAAKAAPAEAAPVTATPSTDTASGDREPVARGDRAPAPEAARPPTLPQPNAAAADRAVAPVRPTPSDVESGVRLPPSEQAAARVDRVLRVAAQAQAASQDKAVFEAIRLARGVASPVPSGESNGRRSIARRLNASAQEAFWTRHNAVEALELQLRAFDANPQDPEIAGNLAFYHLKANPPQPEMARKFALHALAAALPQSGTGRMEDWGNLAVASALSGRQQDATNAMFVMLAVSKDIDRTCRSTRNMIVAFGPRLKPPVEAMFARIHSRGQALSAPNCARPAN